MGITGSAVGIALRNTTLCKGYVIKYAGLSKEQQYISQKVIKINCNTGERTLFPTIADAARNCKVSAPGLRNRINTDCHIENFHWIWDESCTHFKPI